MDSEDILYILYSSGSTGKPKGIVHTSGGYLTHVKATTSWVLDVKDDDLFWCTADVGWVTGHSYLVYGPLSNGATSLMFEGTPSYPKADRFWDIIERHGVNVLYTAPPVIRPSREGGAGCAGQARPSTPRPPQASSGAPGGHRPLHRAHRNPGVHEGRHRGSRKARPFEPTPARNGRRADQPQGLGAGRRA